MSRLVLDPELLAQLRNIREPVELCDPQGRVVGRFTPDLDPRGCEWGRPPVPDEELHRRLAAGGGRTLDAILADLEKRA